jgi:hypothetical protein
VGFDSRRRLRQNRRSEPLRRWSSWFEGLSIVNVGPGETAIVGPVSDQAALHGLLAKVRDLALPLISVRVSDAEHP